MPQFDIFVSGEKAVLDLEYEQLKQDVVLHICNDSANPAEKLFITLPLPRYPNNSTAFDSIIDFHGLPIDLIILINAHTCISNGNFDSFNNILISNHKVLEKNNTEIIIDSNNTYNTQLIIKNLVTKEAYIVCNELSILGKGRVTDTLGVRLKGDKSKLDIKGDNFPKFFVINNFDIQSTLDSLNLDKLLIKKNFSHNHINHLSVKNTKAIGNWDIRNIDNIEAYSLHSTNTVTALHAHRAEITSLKCEGGKFYLSAKSYINFKIEFGGSLEGIELVLDMSEDASQQDKKIKFPPHKFNFERITLINADSITIPTGGSCRELLISDCIDVTLINIVAENIKYNNTRGNGKLICKNIQIIENILIIGDVKAIWDQVNAKNIEGSGLCSIELTSSIKCEMLKLNLNLNAANLNNDIISTRNDNLGIRIVNDGIKQAEITTILAKLSTFYIKGNVKLGNVLIQPIDKVPTLFWVDIGVNTKLHLDALFVGFDHDIEVDTSGSISIIRTKNLLAGSEFYASISSAVSQRSVYVKAGKGIRFNGTLYVIDGDVGLFSKYGDIFVGGTIGASNAVMLSAEFGLVNSSRATLDAKLITLYSHTGTYIAETIMKAQEIVAYSLNHYIQSQGSKLEAQKIAIVARNDINISSSQIQTNQLAVYAGNNIAIQNSQIIAQDVFVQSIHNFILASSNVHLVQYPHVLFASRTKDNDNSDIINGGFKIVDDLTVVAIFSENKNKILSKLNWQSVNIDNYHPTALIPGNVYIEASKGFIIGSTIDASDSVVIKTAHSLEVVPLILYNEIINRGGIKENNIKETISNINAGTINIDAGKAAIFVGSLLKAASGRVNADILYLLRSPEEIKRQQGRVKVLEDFGLNLPPIEIEKMDVQRYFDFTISTSIAQRISNLSHYDNYASNNLSYTQIDGDIILDKSWHSKYEKLYLNAERGKILIVSKNLQSIYKGAGGGGSGRQAAYDSRTVIGGDNIYLAADQVIMQGSKIEAKGDLQIVTKEGVYVLPIAVHERLMYHLGSKTKVEESIVRQIASEIKAGFLDIKAGGALEAVSALIQATGINLDVKELNLKAEYDIFEKQIHFTGKKKWYGGRNSWQDYTQDHLVMPTVISTNSIYAKISGDTTIEAAQILAKEESIMQAGGNISLLPKYDIHLHDHVSKKSHLFRCHGGKLTINSSKTVREHFYGQTPAPTVYYSGGSFFGYSEGKIHLLGAKVIANDIYLSAQKGIKIEAAPYTEENLISISEQGIRAGYNIKSGQASVSAELFKDLDKLQQTRLLYEAAEIMAKNRLVIESEAGDLEVISSKMRFTQAQIKVRGLNIHTHKAVITTDQSHTHMNAGLHVGLQESISTTVKRAGNLINKSGTHWLDILDRGLNGYQLYNELSQIGDDIQTLIAEEQAGKIENLQQLKTVKFGVWIQGSVSTQGNTNVSSQALDNEILGGDIDIQVDDKAIIAGIRCEVDNFSIKADSISISASSNQTTQENYSSEVVLTIPIKGNIEGGVSISASEGASNATTYHADNMIIAKGRLEIDVAGDGKISGVKLQAREVLVRAKNLVVESLQDVLSERLRSMEVNIGSNLLHNLGTKAQVSKRDAAWTNAIGSIIGTQVVNVAVQQTLEIAGGLIANAEVDSSGNLTDKGKAKVTAGTIIAKQLHDYDDGKTFGLGLTLNSKVNSKGDISWGVGMPVRCGFNEQMRDILPTVGHGAIAANDQGGLELLNHDLATHIGATSSESASLDATVPISDMIDLIQSAAHNEGVSAGEEDQGLIDTMVDWVKSLGYSIEKIFKAMDEHGFNDNSNNPTIDNPLEMLDINPAIKPEDAKYCIVMLYDPSVESFINERGVEEYKISEKIPGVSIGHFYNAFGGVVEGKCIKEKLHGFNPKKSRWRYEAKISDESGRYILAKKYEKQYGVKILVEKAIPVTENHMKILKDFYDEMVKRPGMYNVLKKKDCIDYDNQILKLIGLGDLRVTDIIKPNEINHRTLASISSWLRSLDDKIIQGFSSEKQVANAYGIPEARVIRVGRDPFSSELVFKIILHEEYLKNRINK